MTPETINSWLGKNSPEDVFEVKASAAEWYSTMPGELRRVGANLVLLELAIIIFEWNKNRKEPGFVV